MIKGIKSKFYLPVLGLGLGIVLIGCTSQTSVNLPFNPVEQVTATTIASSDVSACSNPTHEPLDLTGISNLNVGDKLPDFSLPIVGSDCNYTLSSQFGESKQVVVLHRGLWCSICLGQLNILQEGQKQINDAGATIVALTPENYISTSGDYRSFMESRANAYGFPSLATGHLPNSDDIYTAFSGDKDGEPRTVLIVDEQGIVTERFVKTSYYFSSNVSLNEVLEALAS